jgi:hypothetical protein
MQENFWNMKQDIRIHFWLVREARLNHQLSSTLVSQRIATIKEIILLWIDLMEKLAENSICKP